MVMYEKGLSSRFFKGIHVFMKDEGKIGFYNSIVKLYDIYIIPYIHVYYILGTIFVSI